MKEAKARSNLFTMLRFDIKGFIHPHSIKCNALTWVDVIVDISLTPLTKKAEIEYNLLSRNPQAYLASGTTLFGHTALGRSIGPTGDYPFADSNRVFSAFTQQIFHLSHCQDIPAAKITEKQL
jgi:hypothetical protein